jgi:hypothetical protein
MQDLLDKMIRFRAIADLIGIVIGGVVIVAVIIYFVFQIVKDNKKGRSHGEGNVRVSDGI